MDAYSLSTAMDFMRDDDNAFPSLLTVLMADDQKNEFHQKRPVFTAIAEMMNLRCRKSPLVRERPARQEVTNNVSTLVTEMYHVTLADYMPAITTDMRVLLDGTEYEIIGVEHDGSTTKSRMRVIRYHR